MIDLNKSQLQEIPLSSGMALLLYWLQRDHLMPFLFLLSSRCFQGCIAHFLLTPHGGFLPFPERISPRGAAKALCRAQVRGVQSSQGAPLLRPVPAWTQSRRHGGVRAVLTWCFSAHCWLKMSSSWASPSGLVSGVPGPRCGCCAQARLRGSLPSQPGRTCWALLMNVVLRLWMIVDFYFIFFKGWIIAWFIFK